MVFNSKGYHMYMVNKSNRNYRGIRSLIYKITKEDKKEIQLGKKERLKGKLLDLVSARKKVNMQERVQIFSNNPKQLKSDE